MSNANSLPAAKNITALILAGGAGSRVAGSDKGLLRFQGEMLVDRQISKLKPQVDSILISANRNLEEYAKLGYPVVEDRVADYPGPLHGVLQGLISCKTAYLFVQPIDVPLLPNDLIQSFCRQISISSNCSISYYLKSSTREHYLSMLVAKSAEDGMTKFLNAGKARVRDLHDYLQSDVIDLNLPESLFRNLNQLSDYSLG